MTLRFKTILFSAIALAILIAAISIFQGYKATNYRLYRMLTKLEMINHASHEITIDILLDLTNVDLLREDLKDVPLISRQLQDLWPTAGKPAELINMELSFVRLKRVVDSLSPGQPLEKPVLKQVRNEIIKISENVSALKYLSEQQISRMQARSESMIAILFLLLVAYIAGLFFFLFGAVIKPLLAFSRQIERVREGQEEHVALSRRKDEIGQLAQEFNQLIDKRRLAEAALREEIAHHKEALEKVKLLSGFLPICSSCKQIRDDRGYWNQIETYIRNNSEAEFTHSICPDCKDKLYGKYFK